MTAYQGREASLELRLPIFFCARDRPSKEESAVRASDRTQCEREEDKLSELGGSVSRHARRGESSGLC